MSAGFRVSAGILVAAVVAAFALIPKRMRTTQATIEVGIGEPVPEAA